MFIELHLLQNFAPSCLNRDDTNSPKDCVFGGVRRARISSQCIKRAMREHALHSGNLDGNLGIRTKRLHGELVKALVEKGKEQDVAASVGKLVLEDRKLTLKEKEGQQLTEYILFLGQSEIDSLAEVIENHWDTLVSLSGAEAPSEEPETKAKAGKKKKSGGALPKEVRDALDPILNGENASDLAMFGRMIANIPESNKDAACQVAHAISTHKVDMDMDFFTAVDDLAPDDTTGADMMGTVEFNSACFYRYAVIHWEKLIENLGGDVDLARKTVSAFTEAAIQSIPTGKQNTFAAHNPPSLGFAVVRQQGAPWSLANAFEAPARANGKGLVAASIEKLNDYYGKLAAVYGDETEAKIHFCLSESDACGNFGEQKTAKGFVDAIVAVLPENAS